MNSGKKKIIGSSLTVASLGLVMAFAISSFAWFRINKIVDGTGMSTRIYTDINLVDFNFQLYKYDKDLKQGIQQIEGSDEFDLELDQYDNFIRERNVHNNRIIRLDASLPYSKTSEEGKRDILITVNCLENEINTTYNAGVTDRVSRIHNDEVGYKYTNQNDSGTYICNNISNVVQFKMFVYKYTVGEEDTILVSSIDETNADTTYISATETFLSYEAKTFVTNSSKTNSFNITVSDINSRASSFILYLEYNYNTDLIDSFLDNTEFTDAQDISMLDGNIIGFNKDISEIRISSKLAE